MLLSLLILESRARLVVGSILVGSTLCLIASYVNTPLFRAADQNMRYFATTISPVIEEILKALEFYGSDLTGKKAAARAMDISLASLYAKLK